MGNKNSKDQDLEFSNFSIIKLDEKIPLKHVIIKSFSGENFMYLEPIKPMKWLDFVLEIKKNNISTLNEVVLHNIEIPINELSDYKRDEKHLLEYKKKVNENNYLIFRYEQNMDLKEIVIRSKAVY